MSGSIGLLLGNFVTIVLMPDSALTQLEHDLAQCLQSIKETQLLITYGRSLQTYSGLKTRLQDLHKVRVAILDRLNKEKHV